MKFRLVSTCSMRSGWLRTKTGLSPKRSSATSPYSRAQRRYSPSRLRRNSGRWPTKNRPGGPGGSAGRVIGSTPLLADKGMKPGRVIDKGRHVRRAVRVAKDGPGQILRQRDQAAAYRAALLAAKADGSLRRVVAASQRLQNVKCRGHVGEILAAQHFQSIRDTAIARIIDVVVGQDMQARRQGPNAQPVAGVDDEGGRGVHAQDIAARITAGVQFARRLRAGLGRARAAEQVAHEQAAAA